MNPTLVTELSDLFDKYQYKPTSKKNIFNSSTSSYSKNNIRLLISDRFTSVNQHIIIIHVDNEPKGNFIFSETEDLIKLEKTLNFIERENTLNQLI